MFVFYRKSFVGFLGSRQVKKRVRQYLYLISYELSFSPNGFEKFVLIFPPTIEIPKILWELCGNSFDLSML